MKNALKLLIVLSILPLAACGTVRDLTAAPDSVTLVRPGPPTCQYYQQAFRSGRRCVDGHEVLTDYSNGVHDDYYTTTPPGQSIGSAALNSVGQALTFNNPADVYVGPIMNNGYYSGGSGYYGGNSYGSSRNPGQSLQNRNSGYGYGGGYTNSYSGPSSSRNVGQAARTRDAGYGR